MTKKLGSLIHEKREEKGLSCTQLAERLHVAPSTVHAWESGEDRPSTEHLILLARLLSTSTDYLLDCTPTHSICLENCDPHKQNLVFRTMRYLDGIPKN